MVRIRWGGSRTMNKAIVTSRFAFPGEVEKIGGLTNQDWAFISITSTPECAKYYLTKIYQNYNLTMNIERKQHICPQST